MSATGTPVLEYIAIGTRMAEIAAARPGASAITSQGVTRSWGELHKRTNRMARGLLAHGVKLGDFVTIARLRGESAWSVMRRELVPNATSVLLVEFALRAGYAPVLIGSLGFLGFGMRPPTPEWGLMISENRALLLISPVTVLGPGLALASLVVGLNLFTEGLARILGRSVKLGTR